MNQIEALQWGTQTLSGLEHSNSSQEAFWLLAKAQGLKNPNLSAVLTDFQWSGYQSLVLNRMKRMPLSYIMGESEFMGLNLKVNSCCLIPRPETEILVEQALQICKTMESPKILEIGTGSGAISISLAHECAFASLTATDISKEALAIAVENAQIHGVQSKILFLEGALFNPLKNSQTQQFDMILSNPPYIKSDEISNLQREIRHEPSIALDGGMDGLSVIKPLIEGSVNYLNKEGSLLLEIGDTQAFIVSQFMSSIGFLNIKLTQDENGLDRVIQGVWNG